MQSLASAPLPRESHDRQLPVPPPLMTTYRLRLSAKARWPPVRFPFAGVFSTSGRTSGRVATASGAVATARGGSGGRCPHPLDTTARNSGTDQRCRRIRSHILLALCWRWRQVGAGGCGRDTNHGNSETESVSTTQRASAPRFCKDSFRRNRDQDLYGNSCRLPDQPVVGWSDRSGYDRRCRRRINRDLHSRSSKRNATVTHLTKSLCLLAFVLSCLTSFAREYEGSRSNSVLLNGSWEFVRGEGDEHAETAPAARSSAGNRSRCRVRS